MQQYQIIADNSQIGQALDFIESQAGSHGIPKGDLPRFMLYSEELLVQLIANAKSSGSKVTLKLGGKGKNVRLIMSCSGQKFDLVESSIINEDIKDTSKAELDDEQTLLISRLILKSYSNRFSVRNIHGTNITRVNAPSKETKSMGILAWVLMGIAFGLVLKLLTPKAVVDFISGNILGSVTTMFLTAMKMLVTPMVFFSIADSLSGFSDLKSFGRVGGKVMGLYLASSVVAVLLAFGVFCIFQPGGPELLPELMAFISGSSSIATTIDVSLKDTIVGIVPNSFLGAFVEQDMIQVIFLAILVGFAATRVEKNSDHLQTFISAGNSLFSELVAIIIKVLKPACFCMMANNVIAMTLSSLVQQAKLMLVLVASSAALVVVYCIIVLLWARLNPFKFFSKFKDAIMTALSTLSSSATVPTSMKCCEKMGIPSKVYSFSIPLGATVNMNGCCLFFVAVSMFMARIVGIPTDFAVMVPLFLTIVLLAISAPGVPGASIACMSVLFVQIGIPVEAVGFILCTYSISEFLITLINVMGDAIVTTLVAKSENLMDLSVYNS